MSSHEGIDVRRGADRFVTRMEGMDGIETWHSFSFGAHYDPDNVAYGALLAHNEELLAPGAGYPEHAHRGVDILTWVLDGLLLHADSMGRRVELPAGTVALLSAGRGIRHAERNASPSLPLRFVQLWVQASADGAPRYQTWEAGGLREPERPAPVARLHDGDCVAYVAALPAGGELVLPTGRLHVYVGRGAVRAGTETLEAGDVARIGAASGVRVTAQTDAELLCCAMRRAGPPAGRQPRTLGSTSRS